MSSQECGEEYTSSDGVCDNDAKFPDGKCGQHSAYADGSDDDWSPNYKHGLYMDRSGYYNALPSEDQEWIDAVVGSFLKDAPFGADELGKLAKLREVAIDMHKKRRADDYIYQRGMTQTHEVGYHEDYGVLEEEKENVLHVTASRLSKDSLRTLKDLGILGNDDNAEEVGETVIEALSKKVEDED